LSFARHGENLNLPGEYLNSVLIDMNKKQSPKKPSLVKNIRKVTLINTIILE
jgi:hypothetical protein